MQLEQKVYETIPAGRYDARLIDVEVKDSKFGDGARYLKLTFEIEDPEYRDVNVTAFANALFSTRSKLYKWARALFGKPIPTSYTLDTGDLLQRPCELGIEVVEDDGTEFNRVDGVYPRRQRTPSAPAEQAPAEAAQPASTEGDAGSWGKKVPF
jgi:hypothetical protein